jgi:hypothetical protein
MQRTVRRVRRTIQIVCEGYAEEYFLKHVRSLYLARSGDVALTVKNARGKGGRAVLNHALSPRFRGHFDVMAILIDTDQDWGDAERARAKAGEVVVLESTPCLEAWLLAVNGHASRGNSAHCKREFERRFGAEAHEAEVYVRHFNRAVLDAARSRVRVLEQLLLLIGPESRG